MKEFNPDLLMTTTFTQLLDYDDSYNFYKVKWQRSWSLTPITIPKLLHSKLRS